MTAHGHAALIELFSEQAIRPADGSHCARRFAIGLQNPLNIVFLAAAVVHGFRLNLAARAMMAHQ